MKKGNIFDLSNQKILLTGATGHLGSSILKILLEFNAHVFINSRNKKKVNELKDGFLILSENIKLFFKSKIFRKKVID